MMGSHKFDGLSRLVTRFATALALLTLTHGLTPLIAQADGYRAGQDTEKPQKSEKSDKSKKEEPDAPLTNYERALKLIQKKLCERAQEVLDPMIKQGVGSEVALLDIGTCYMQEALDTSNADEARRLRETGVGWVLRAGNAGLRRAEEELVRQYIDGEVFLTNPVEAGKWYLLWKANRSGYAITPPEFDEKLEQKLQSMLTTADWVSARDRALAWRPVYQ